MNIRRLLSAGLLGAGMLLAANQAAAQASVVGQWSRMQPTSFAAIHNVLMPNGKVMVIGKNALQQLYDPATQGVGFLPSPGYDLFCAGHVHLADGRILLAGGHIADFVGLAKTSIYNPATNSWTPVPDMNAGRWYPTVTTLPNGDLLVVSGEMDTQTGANPLPQVYQVATNTWRNLTNAQLVQGLYPMMFVAPNGRVVDVGPSEITRSLDTSGTGSWSYVDTNGYGWRDYGSAVMYADGKILLVGGANPPTASAQVLNLNDATPRWRWIAQMSVPRRHLNATVLPDGKVLVTGGTSGSGHNNTSTPVFHAEMFDPDPNVESWTRMASASIPRLYHSSAMLLPDGRVMTNGGDGYTEVEVFSPPYLFKGTRPTMSGAPSTVGYGQRFTVQTPNAADIRKVTLIRLSSVTHAFDMNQRLNVLPFTPGSGTLEITAPANANLAPPGHYWLFIVDANGVPSVASMVSVGGGGGTTTPPPTAPPPALSALSPATASAGGPAFTLTVDGSNFVSGAAVRWNGAARATSFVSSTRVTAAIGSGDIAAAQTAQVTVANPDGGVSGALPFTVTAAAPPGPTYSLSVTRTGTNASKGTVTSSPGGINCGLTCTANFSSGATVTLTARAFGNGAFAGWGGACSGTGTCTVTMNANTAVTAAFNRR